MACTKRPNGTPRLGIFSDSGDIDVITRVRLAAKMEPFDSFWEGPQDIEKGYGTFGQFYKHNYLQHMPADKSARILVVSCGPGYFLNTLKQAGYTNVL